MDATNSSNPFEGAEVISSYSRAQAIDDGVLVDLSTVAPEICSQHFKVPVACTASVWAIIDKAVKNKRHCNDLNGVLHDVFGMSKLLGRNLDETTRIFKVIITGAGRSRYFTFKMVCGPNDDASPCMTLMLPEED